MAGNVNNNVGEVKLKMGVDDSSTGAEAKAAAEKANAAADAAQTSAINKRDAALRARQAKLSAEWKREQDAAKAVVVAESKGAADSFLATGAGAEKAAEQTGKLATGFGVVKTALGGLRAALGPFMFALGALATAYELITSRAEAYTKKLADQMKAHVEISASLRDLKESFDNTLNTAPKDQVADELKKITEQYDKNLTEIYNNRNLTEQAYQEFVKKNIADRADAEAKVYRNAEERARTARSRVEQDARVKAEAEKAASLDAKIKSIDDQIELGNARAKEFDKLTDMMEQYEKDVAESARKIKESYAAAFQSIRDESNKTFGNSQVFGSAGITSALTSLNTRAGASSGRITWEGTG